jgi:hypothetical protein
MHDDNYEALIKEARLTGVTRALLESGYTPGEIKLAFLVSDIHPATQLDAHLKEAASLDLDKLAIWGAVAGMATRGAGLLAKAAPKLMQGAKTVGQASGRLQGSLAQGGRMSQLAGRAVGTGGRMAGKAMKGLGKQTYQAVGGLRQGAQALQAAPGKALGSGALNAAKGFTGLGTSKGVGGAVGRTGMYGSIGSGMLTAGSAIANNNAPQQMVSPQMRMYGG